MHNCTQQSFLLYLASLRETPRDGGRDEEIRLNRIWLETRHTPQTLFLYRANRLAFRYRRHLPCSLGREIEPATTTTAVVYTQPREHGSSSVDEDWGDAFRSIVRHSPRFFAARESGVKSSIWPILYISWRSIAIGADIQDKDRPVFRRA